MNVGNKIKQLRKTKGITQKQLAEKLGLAPTAISAWERNANKPMMDSLSLMSEIFEVPVSEFYEGYNEAETKLNSIMKEAKNTYYISRKTISIPILGSISCGEPLLAEENVKEYRQVSVDLLPAGNLFYLEANGDSMQPSIPNGSLVLIREQPEVENGQVAAVLVNGNEEATLKRVRIQNGNIILYPDNSNYEPIFVTKENPVKILGLAVEVNYKI